MISSSIGLPLPSCTNLTFPPFAPVINFVAASTAEVSLCRAALFGSLMEVCKNLTALCNDGVTVDSVTLFLLASSG